MKEDKSFLEVIGGLVFILLAQLLLMLWVCAIIQQTIRWYDIPIAMTNKQIFGSILIISLIRHKKSDSEDKWYEILVYQVAAILLSWGVMYLFHFFV